MTIRVVVDDSTYCQGDEVTGTVYVTGGDREVRIESLKLELQEHWQEAAGQYQNNRIEARETSVLEADPLTIVPGFERAYPLAFQLPQNCRLSTPISGWQIVATADRRLRFDIWTELRLLVIPAKVILAFVEACVSRLKYAVTSQSWYSSTRTTHIEMQPPVALQSQIDNLLFA